MKISFTYMGQLRHFANKDEETRDFEDANSLLDMLKTLAEEYGEDFQKVVFSDENTIRPSVMILINEEPANKDELPTLKDGDTLTILTAIAGG